MRRKCMYNVLRCLYESKGNIKYMDTQETHFEHALKSYLWMKNHPIGKNSSNLRSAAFLHDIGHLLNNNITPYVGDKHEIAGYSWLKKNGFSEAVYFPIKYHVLANRYLVTRDDKNYYQSLSKTNKLTFMFNGGYLTNRELEMYEKFPYFKDAILIHTCDERSSNLELTNVEELEKSIKKDIEQSFKY